MHNLTRTFFHVAGLKATLGGNHFWMIQCVLCMRCECLMGTGIKCSDLANIINGHCIDQKLDLCDDKHKQGA